MTIPNRQRPTPKASALRVIAGRYKGRRLKGPSWEGLRPTSDKLRETLFNVLGPRVSGARVLDGFAGTGAIGIEALSRGAAHVTFVESDHRAAALIADNLAACDIEEGYTIQRAEFVGALDALQASGTFDLILLDPPYDLDHVPAVLDAAARHVAAGGLVVLEHASRRALDETVSLRRVRDIRSGDSSIGIYAARDPGSGIRDPNGSE